MMIVLDTYAWIEYVKGSRIGEKVSEIVREEGNELFTVECTLAEVVGFLLRNNLDIHSSLQIIKANSEVLKLCEDDWVSGARECHEQRKEQKDFGLIDALILTKAKERGARIVTGDDHFKKLKNVIFLS